MSKKFLVRDDCQAGHHTLLLVRDVCVWHTMHTRRSMIFIRALTYAWYFYSCSS